MTLEISRAPLMTERLELRRTAVEDAAAMFEALKHRHMYAYIPRSPPLTVADVEKRFARIMVETAPDRTDQWLNWTVWLRETGAALGMVEATIDAEHGAIVGYLFDPRVWRRGYGREAVAAMLAHLAGQGARGFEATIDVRNTGSRALAAALGFAHVETVGVDETWRRGA